MQEIKLNPDRPYKIHIQRDNSMALPQYFCLTGIIAHVGAVIGALYGVVIIFGHFSTFGHVGVLSSLLVVFQGMIISLISLASMGVVNCFLAITKAQIEHRNMHIKE
jgi:hypothetical protein